MYRLKLATTKKDIFDFEQKRTNNFTSGKMIQTWEEATYAQEIEKGDMLAFLCIEDEKTIGGMLLAPEKNWMKILRLFVDQEKREKGAGSFMLNYVENHREFFEDYYGTFFEGILVEPLQSGIDYYFEKGYDYHGFQMYKRYNRSDK